MAGYRIYCNILVARNQCYILPSFGSSRSLSSDIPKVSNPSLSALKRGSGGRSSFNGIIATVFGSSGFLGRYVCNRLGKIGTQLILPYRCDAYEMLRLKLVGDLGQVLFHPFHLKDEDSIRKAVCHSNVVINLVGRDWETKNFTYDDVHVHGARRLAKICKESGVETFLHMSSLNVAENVEEFMIKGGSRWLKSKWESELAVRDEFPEAIIFRPSDIYGQEDRFLRYFCSNWRHQLGYMPLYKKGECTIKQPVFVSDVAAGIVAAVNDKDAIGKIFQAVGPKRYYLSELLDWFYRVMRKTDEFGYMRYDLKYDPLFQLRVSLQPYFSLGTPIGFLHWEQLEKEAHTDQVDLKIPTLEDLGITLTQMEDQVPWEIKVYRAHQYYDEELGEFEPPAPPQPCTN